MEPAIDEPQLWDGSADWAQEVDLSCEVALFNPSNVFGWLACFIIIIARH
jgi:hypothetical protein